MVRTGSSVLLSGREMEKGDVAASLPLFGQCSVLMPVCICAMTAKRCPQ